MTFAVALQMDPIEHVDISADSTFAIAMPTLPLGEGTWHGDFDSKVNRSYDRYFPFALNQ